MEVAVITEEDLCSPLQTLNPTLVDLHRDIPVYIPRRWAVYTRLTRVYHFNRVYQVEVDRLDPGQGLRVWHGEEGRGRCACRQAALARAGIRPGHEVAGPAGRGLG